MILHDFLSQPFNKENFKKILTLIFPSIHFTNEVKISLNNAYLKGFTQLCKPLNLENFKLGVGIFETTSIRAKIGIHSEILRLLKNGDLSGILCVFCENSHQNSQNSATPSLRSDEIAKAIHNAKNSQNPQEFRLSLITSGFDYESNKITHSSLKRQSFILGHSKTHTAQKALATLISKAQKNITLQDLENAFSQEPVSKEFYKEIIEQYLEILECATFPTHAIKKVFV